MKKCITLGLLLIILLCFAPSAFAASYTYYLGDCYGNYNRRSYTVSNIDLMGLNKTHGFTQKIIGTVSSTLSSNYYHFTLTYNLPDDGSTWQIVGSVNMVSYEYSTEGYVAMNFFAMPVNDTKNTSGTFTGVSIKTATDAANAANTAAGQAKISADTASTRALNAYNSVYNANGNTITAVRDGSGTVLSEARQAKTNASNAGTYASQASTNALNAYNTAQTVNTKIDSLSTAVTNIQNNIGLDTSPPVVQIATVSGALATSGNSISAVVNVSDNVSTAFEYSLNGTVYQSLPANGVVSLPISAPGANLITVWVKDGAGNVGRNSITIRKL
ncbi:MAG: hypothetical protein M1130_11845 [Actinobacteria bacterium]|nr:hypothetical protein [Actinomycetota bacterium]